MKLPANVDKSQHPRDDVTHDDWAQFCMHWETDKFKARSLKNKERRKGNDVPHRGGCRCFARSRVEMVNPETNEEPDEISFYKLMHHNSTKCWTASHAEDNMIGWWRCVMRLLKRVQSLKSLKRSEKPGYTPGLGYGVVPPTRRAGVPAAVAVVAHADMEQLRTRAESAEREMQELREHGQLREQRSSQERQLDYIMLQIRRPPAS